MLINIKLKIASNIWANLFDGLYISPSYLHKSLTSEALMENQKHKTSTPKEIEMSTAFKKIFTTCLLVLVVLTTGAWQSDHVVLAESQYATTPETPLYPGLTWSSLGLSTQDITINVNGDTISLSGEGDQAVKQFASGIPQDVLNYYSNEQLARSGWASYDAFERPDGSHYVFYHESGVYLFVEFLKCPDVSSSICVTIWKSAQTNPRVVMPIKDSKPGTFTTTGTFGKTAPANGATNLNPTSIVLAWGAYIPAPDKYSYCVKDGSACDANDPNWTSTFNTSITLSNLDYGKTYYWQVKAITCVTCVPKKFVYADNGTVWTFKTKLNSQATILGNVGVPGAVLSYTDGTLKTVTADGVGAYSITVPLNWSGILTPAKTGYLFSPKNATFSNLTAVQTIQNFTAVVAFAINGNVGVSGVKLSYTDGTPQTVISDSSGNYSIIVPTNWSGTVTPSQSCFIFSPTSRNYSNVTTNQTAQNYISTFNATPECKVTTGVFRPSNGLLYLKNTNATGFADVAINYGLGGDYPVVGDWNGNGTATIGIYRNGSFYLRNSNTVGFADLVFAFGQPGDQPIAGDWNGDGLDTIGVFRPATGQFLLRDSNSAGAADYSFFLGNVGDVGIAGDWTKKGFDTVGVFRPSNGIIFLKNTNATGFADIALNYGLAGDQPIVGDWDGNGTDTIGVYRNAQFFLRNSNTNGFADIVFGLGNLGDVPIAGNWDGLP